MNAYGFFSLLSKYRLVEFAPTHVDQFIRTENSELNSLSDRKLAVVSRN